MAVTPDEADRDEFLLDRIDALRVVRADTPEDRSRLLEEIAGHGKPEQDIVRELSKVRPLWRPDRFEEAHRMVMRSLEVLDRNGSRPASVARLGPLSPVARWTVQQVNRWIVKSHQNTLAEQIRKLYERREANSVWGSPEHRMLRRARLDAQRVESGLKGRALGLPTFLIGGAFLSSVFSVLGRIAEAVFGDDGSVALQIAVVVLVVAVLLSLAWVILFAAAVSRRRIRLTVDQPLAALYETIGACGNPPRDRSFDFALYALVFLVLAALVVPAIGTVVIAVLS
jgi:hypothetical protein